MKWPSLGLTGCREEVVILSLLIWFTLVGEFGRPASRHAERCLAASMTPNNTFLEGLLTG